ncbi:MAG TPA: YbjQ family protein [Gemmatimonadaceae bacterium]
MSRLAQPEFLTTTSIAIDGFDVVQTFGVVRGIVVRSRSVFGQVGIKIQTFFGGNISLLEELCEQTRAEAFAKAVEHARALGANALIAVRYDATEILPGVSEVLCYGTATRLAPQARP